MDDQEELFKVLIRGEYLGELIIKPSDLVIGKYYLITYYGDNNDVDSDYEYKYESDSDGGEDYGVNPNKADLKYLARFTGDGNYAVEQAWSSSFGIQERRYTLHPHTLTKQVKIPNSRISKVPRPYYYMIRVVDSKSTELLRFETEMANYIRENKFKKRTPMCIEYMDDNGVRKKVVAFLATNSMKDIPTENYLKKYIRLVQGVGSILITTNINKYAFFETKFNINDMISVPLSKIYSISEKPMEIEINFLNVNMSTPQFTQSFPIMTEISEINNFVYNKLRERERQQYPNRAPINRKIGIGYPGQKDLTGKTTFVKIPEAPKSLLLKYLQYINCDELITMNLFYYFNLEEKKGGNRKRKTLKMRRKQGGNSFHKSCKSHNKRNATRAKKRNSKGNKTRS